MFAMMNHPLDNPAWTALNSGNKHLARGNDQAKYFDHEVSPFAGLKDNSEEDFSLLYGMIPRGIPVGIIAPGKIEIPPIWEIMHNITSFQMIYPDKTAPGYAGPELTRLQHRHIPDMIALTTATKPGPFGPGTINFGHYYGIFDGSKLIAMAGQRLHMDNFMEISAVCTHPDYTGRGYAQQLLLFHINRILAASGVPVLHVRRDNDRAISVYKRLGFVTRSEINFYFLRKRNNELK